MSVSSVSAQAGVPLPGAPSAETPGDSSRAGKAPDTASKGETLVSRSASWADRNATSSSQEPEGPIRAYAKLEFPGFSYYIQTLQVTIGRRPQAPASASPSWRANKDVDVDLGPLKSISRLHARIFYSVQPDFYRSSLPMLAPPGAAPDASETASSLRASSPSKPEGRFLLEVLGRNGAFVDDVWVSMNGVVPLSARTKIQIAERVFYFVLPPPPEADGAADSGAEAESDHELLAAASSSELSDVDADEPKGQTAPTPKFVLKPRAKLGKAPKRPHTDVATENDASEAKRHRPSEEAISGPCSAHSVKSEGDAEADSHSRTSTSPAALSALAVAANTVPMFQKPDLSNVQLITNALSSESCAKKGHKLTLQEVYEWLQNTYPWFSQNGRKNGRDWQSSIRHTIGTSREFCKIPRRPDEPGKGIFYTLSTTDVAKAHEAASRQDGSAAPTTTTPAANDTPPSGTAPASEPGGDRASTSATPPHAPRAMPRIPLVVGVPPTVERAAAQSKGVPGSIESLLEAPPIAHHQGQLYLSPAVFGHLTSEQLSQIEGLGAQQALQVLQTYLVSHLKEKMKKAKSPEGTAPPSSSSTYDQRLEVPKVPRIPLSTSSDMTTASAAPASHIPTPTAAPASTASVAPTSAAPPCPAPSTPAAPSASARPADKSDDPLSALSALAAHPEAAGLIALLKKQQAGGSGTVRLSPGQLELLQLANRLAMQRKKKASSSGTASSPSESRPPSGPAPSS
ncbi:Pre-rRNA-processing protein fhl1 [Malassezia equina]|uniref:Pre-rRNA-processing protein fhl1 n=1 Tax=Malassezia equina TaxID=1381935 RepID=A0AAF0J018_9BASI|nr:Pre-rRNA-processing protein fhl1 [Malassezia equina]